MGDGPKVVAFTDGKPVANPHEPDEVTIKALEWLLERAKGGEIVGIAYACGYHDNTTTSHYAGRVSRSIVGAMFGVMQRISKAIDES